jgi:hypothetical protein
LPPAPPLIFNVQPTRPLLPAARYSNVVTVLDAKFEFGSEDNFHFSPNIFHKQEHEISHTAVVGFSETTKVGYRETLTVEMGGSQDDALVVEMSAGWERDFSLSHTSDVTVIVVFQVEAGASLEQAWFVQALCSVDGVLHGRNATVDYLARVEGTVQSARSEFETVTLRIPNMPSGPHVIGVGGLLHIENGHGNAMAWVRFDRVVVVAASPTSKTPKKPRLRQRLE